MSKDLISGDKSAVCEVETASVPEAATTVATLEKTVYRMVEDFVAHVIYDGRYMDSFSVEPERVAALLGVELAPELVEDLRGRSRDQLLTETTKKLTWEYGERHKSVDPARPEIIADFGVVIGAAVIGTAVVIGACIVLDAVPNPCSATGMCAVEDHSPDANEKL